MLTSRLVAVKSGDDVARFFRDSTLSPFTTVKNWIVDICKLKCDLTTARSHTGSGHMIVGTESHSLTDIFQRLCIFVKIIISVLVICARQRRVGAVFVLPGHDCETVRGGSERVRDDIAFGRLRKVTEFHTATSVGVSSLFESPQILTKVKSFGNFSCQVTQTFKWLESKCDTTNVAAAPNSYLIRFESSHMKECVWVFSDICNYNENMMKIERSDKKTVVGWLNKEHYNCSQKLQNDTSTPSWCVACR